MRPIRKLNSETGSVIGWLESNSQRKFQNDRSRDKHGILQGFYSIQLDQSYPSVKTCMKLLMFL